MSLNTLQKEKIKTTNILVFVLMLISIVVVTVQSLGFYKTLRIDDVDVFDITAVDDRLQGGKSIADISIEDNKYVLNCEIIRSGYAWPFCEIRFDVKPDEAGQLGLNLSEYSEVIIAAKYREDKHNDRYSVRFQIRNFHSDYSTEKDEDSLKYNGIEYRFKDDYPSYIPFENMQVLSWWIAERAIPMEHQRLDVSDVRYIELATGNFMRKGRYAIEIEFIELRGKWVSDAAAYLALVIMWVMSAALYLLNLVIQHQKVALKMADKNQELNLINSLLDNKSKELEQKANRDALTGVLNRAGLGVFIEQHRGSGEVDTLLSVLYLDIDFFKRVNDDYSHQTGDEVLIKFAQLLEQSTRDVDLLARWGGEEFILICPNTSLHNAARLGEKLRKIIEQSDWPQGIKLTMSSGVAQHQIDESMTELFDRADQALYQAKQNGRNRVEVAK
jgi:diguanylate cyclase (GGDEF)-like protein